nr:glycine-rich cell wall structural protein 1-like [Setaria viridis]
MACNGAGGSIGGGGSRAARGSGGSGSRGGGAGRSRGGGGPGSRGVALVGAEVVVLVGAEVPTLVGAEVAVVVGLGRDSDGNVVASEEWWKANTKDASSSTEYSSDDEDNYRMEDCGIQDETTELIMNTRKRNREVAFFLFTIG